MTAYRIHGDNIVECERIASLIVQTLQPEEIGSYLISPSTVTVEFKTTFEDILVHFLIN